MSELKDPRVLFAAERTLLAWNRTTVSLISLGFVIERFGLVVHQLGYAAVAGQRSLSFTIGIVLIGFAMLLSLISIIQYRFVLKTLNSSEVPPGYWVWSGAVATLSIFVLGIVLVFYLTRGFS